jgi:hypothetical protein
VLSGKLGPKRYEVTAEWRKLHNEGLYDLYCSPNIVRVIKSRRKILLGHVARMGDRYIRGFCWESLKKRAHVQDISGDGRTILIWIFRTWYGKAWTGLNCLR